MKNWFARKEKRKKSFARSLAMVILDPKKKFRSRDLHLLIINRANPVCQPPEGLWGPSRSQNKLYRGYFVRQISLARYAPSLARKKKVI